MADMRVPIPVTRDNHGRDTADYTRLDCFVKIEEVLSLADMRVPMPVTRDNHGRDTADYTRLEWFAKIVEETHEAMNADDKHLPEELTDIITVCVSFLNALGYNELERAELQRDVNAKNYRRGYWRLIDHEDL